MKETKREHPHLAKLRRDPRFLSMDRVGDLKLLHGPFKAKIESIIQEARAQGVEFAVLETYRSKERQAELFRQGRTKLKNVGVHHYGLAVDLVLKTDGKLDWDGDYSLLGKLARKHGLIWGGAWRTFRDSYHVQAIPLRDQGRLFRGEWFPD